MWTQDECGSRRPLLEELLSYQFILYEHENDHGAVVQRCVHLADYIHQRHRALLVARVHGLAIELDHLMLPIHESIRDHPVDWYLKPV